MMTNVWVGGWVVELILANGNWRQQAAGIEIWGRQHTYFMHTINDDRDRRLRFALVEQQLF
jgi:hypothetical protein